MIVIAIIDYLISHPEKAAYIGGWLLDFAAVYFIIHAIRIA